MDRKSTVKTNLSFTNKNIFILGIFTIGVNISMKSLGLFNKVLTKKQKAIPSTVLKRASGTLRLLSTYSSDQF